jgi:hypothetical protein
VTDGLITAPKGLDKMNKMNRMLAANRLAILSILYILSNKAFGDLMVFECPSGRPTRPHRTATGQLRGAPDSYARC